MTASWKTVSGFKIENDIVMAFSIGAGDQIHLISEGLRDESNVEILPGLYGEHLNLRDRQFSGEISVDYHISDYKLLAFCLGFSHLTFSPLAYSLTSELHYFEPDYNLVDRNITQWDINVPVSKKLRRRATFAFYKGNSIWEFAHTYCRSWSFNISREGVTLNMSVIASRLLIDPSWNNSTNNWSFPIGDKVRLDQAKVYLWPRHKFNLASSGTLVFDELDGEGAIVMTIPAGNYLGNELAERIALEMTTNSNINAEYQGSWDWQTKRLRFSGNKSFRMISSGSLYERLGFNTNTDYGVEHIAQASALFDEINPITDSNLVKVQSITFNCDNGLRIGQTKSSGFAPQVYSTGDPQITGEIQFARYDTNPIFEKFNGRELFGLRVDFVTRTIPGVTPREERLMFHFPAVILSGKTSIKQTGILKPDANFVCVRSPNFDFMNEFNDSYLNWNNVRFGVNRSNSVRALGIYRNNLCWGESTKVFKLSDNESDPVEIASLVGAPNALIEYNDVLYIGCNNGRIYSYSGGSATHLLTLSATGIQDFLVFDGYLYAIGKDAKVYRTNTPDVVWSTVYTGSGIGHKIYSAFGSVYAMIDGKVYRATDGVTFVLEFDFGNTPTYMSACLHDGVMWFFSDFKVKYDRMGVGDIVDMDDLTYKVIHAISWGGAIMLCLLDFTDGFFARYRPLSNDLIGVSVEASIPTVYGKPIIYRGDLFLTGINALLYFEQPQKMIVFTEIESSENLNPLLPIN